MNDDDVTQWEDWNEDPDHLPPAGTVAASVALAIDEQLEHQEELWQQCIAASQASQALQKNSEHSEDSEGMPIPDPEDSGVVRVVAGHGLQVAYTREGPVGFRQHRPISPGGAEA
jgi:hypothetical protein